MERWPGSICTDPTPQREGCRFAPAGKGGVDHPRVYISQKLTDRETWYSTMQKECLAILWAVDSLRYYLVGCSFTCSDHRGTSSKTSFNKVPEKCPMLEDLLLYPWIR